MSEVPYERSNARESVEQRRAEWTRRLEAELNRIGEELRACPGVKRVIVFGSLGRGEARWRSDLDLIVIQETDQPPLQRVETLLRYLRPRIQTDLLVYTPQEWEAPDRPAFLRNIEQRGRILHGAKG